LSGANMSDVLLCPGTIQACGIHIAAVDPRADTLPRVAQVFGFEQAGRPGT